jgi:hypothetical protein
MIALPRQVLAIGIAGAFAAAVPIWVLWPGAPEPRPESRTKLTQLRITDVPTLDNLLRAPLFNVDRAPAVTADVAGASAPTPSPLPILIGTIADGRSGGVALAKSLAGETLTLSVGQDIDGWRLARIGNGSAEFIKGDRHETVSLDFRNRDATLGSPAISQTQATPEMNNTSTTNDAVPQ